MLLSIFCAVVRVIKANDSDLDSILSYSIASASCDDSAVPVVDWFRIEDANQV